MSGFPSAAEAAGKAIANALAGSEIVLLIQTLEHAKQGCEYAAEDYAERANFEGKHDGSEVGSYTDAADEYDRTSKQLGELASELHKANEAVESEDE